MPHGSSLFNRSVSKNLKEIVSQKSHKEPKYRRAYISMVGRNREYKTKRSFDPSIFTGRKQVRKILRYKHGLLFVEKEE